MESKARLDTELILVIGTLGMLLLTSAIIFFIYLFQRKLIRRNLEYQEIENLLKRQELKSAYALLEGQDMERIRIAKELHDNIGTIFATLNLYVNAFLKENDPNEQYNLGKKISSIAEQAYKDARDLSHRLDNASLTHFGFRVALEDLVSVVNDAKGIEVKLTFECSCDLNMELSFNLYRVLQELVNNTLKHANASEISIEITNVRSDYLSVIYQDNGIGFIDPSKAAKGLGLKNIATRLEKINASIVLDEKPAIGLTAIIEAPLQQ